VTNVTLGTVTAEVTTEPAAVIVKVTVVTGTATGGGVEGPETGGLGPRPFPLVAVAVCVTTPVTGVGTSVMVLGTPVQIPGF